MIYAYLTDPRRCLSVANLVYRDSTMSRDEHRPIPIDNDGSVCLTRPDQASVSPLMMYYFFDRIPLWIDLLPGRYNMTCQMRLRPNVRECSSLIDIK